MIPDAAIFARCAIPTGRAGAAIGAARRQLKRLLAETYATHAAAAPYGVPVAVACLAMEHAIGQEWLRLDQLEAQALAQWLPLKQRCNHTVVPMLATHLRAVAAQAPERSSAVANEVAAFHGATVTLTPNSDSSRPLQLPIVPEKAWVAEHGWDRSQMVRASTPWVQYWQTPTLTFARKALPLSDYATHYRHDTQHFTIQMARWQAEDYGTYLYILADSEAHKGQQIWTTPEGAERTTELFGILSHASQPSRFFMGNGVFATRAPITAVAHGMMINTNPHDPERPPPHGTRADWQRVIGWDTLQWLDEPRVPEWRYGNREPLQPLEQPRFHMGWHARLVPVTATQRAAALDACSTRTTP